MRILDRDQLLEGLYPERRHGGLVPGENAARGVGPEREIVGELACHRSTSLTLFECKLDFSEALEREFLIYL